MRESIRLKLIIKLEYAHSYYQKIVKLHKSRKKIILLHTMDNQESG